MKHEFPKYFYHKQVTDGKIVRSQDEFDKLGSGWLESYSELEKPSEEKLEPSVDDYLSEDSDEAAEVSQKPVIKKRKSK